jgi:hypothetical protein
MIAAIAPMAARLNRIGIFPIPDYVARRSIADAGKRSGQERASLDFRLAIGYEQCASVIRMPA